MRTAAMDDYSFNEIKSHPPKKTHKNAGRDALHRIR